MRIFRLQLLRFRIRTLMFLTALMATGLCLRFGLTRHATLRKAYMIEAITHARWSAHYRNSIPHAQDDVEEARSSKRSLAKMADYWGKDEAAKFDEQSEGFIGYHKMRVAGFRELADYHEKLRAKYANACKWPLLGVPPDPPEPPDPNFAPWPQPEVTGLKIEEFRTVTR